MTNLSRQIELYRQAERQLSEGLAFWDHHHHRLCCLVRSHEAQAGLAKVSSFHQQVWCEFRLTHSLRQTAQVLYILDLRGFGIADFVEAWRSVGNLPLALNLLWRTSGHNR